MLGEVKTSIIFLILLAMTSSCSTVTQSTMQATITPITVNTLSVFDIPAPTFTRPPTSTAIPNTPTATDIFTPTSTITSVPTFTTSPTLQNPPTRSSKIVLPKELNLDEWNFTNYSDLERIKGKYEHNYRFDVFPSPLIFGPYNKILLNGYELRATEEIVGSKTIIHVIYNGKEISRADTGYSSTSTNIWGLWTYQNQWIMEYISVFRDPYDRIYNLGNIIWDGESLNSKYGYQESFGLTAIDGRIFYFFKRNNQIGIVYDGKEYNLGYEKVTRYKCCGLSDTNPHGIGSGWQWNQNLGFFAEREGIEYFVVISKD